MKRKNYFFIVGLAFLIAFMFFLTEYLSLTIMYDSYPYNTSIYDNLREQTKNLHFIFTLLTGILSFVFISLFTVEIVYGKILKAEKEKSRKEKTEEETIENNSQAK